MRTQLLGGSTIGNCGFPEFVLVSSDDLWDVTGEASRCGMGVEKSADTPRHNGYRYMQYSGASSVWAHQESCWMVVTSGVPVELGRNSPSPMT